MIDLVEQHRRGVGLEQFQIAGNDGLKLQLADRPEGNVKEVDEFLVSASSAALGDVRADGDGGTSHLRRQAEALTKREITCRPIDAARQRSRTRGYP